MQHLHYRCAVVGARHDIEGLEIGRSDEIDIDSEGADGSPIAIGAELIEPRTLRNVRRLLEKLGHTRMAIKIATLGLELADLGQLGGAVEWLVASRAKQDARRLA